MENQLWHWCCPTNIPQELPLSNYIDYLLGLKNHKISESNLGSDELNSDELNSEIK